MTVDSSLSASETRGQFAEATITAASAVHTALAALVAAVPGNIAKPRELEHALRIDYKLAWRVFLVLRAPDAISIASLIPKQPSVQRLLKAAHAAALPADVIGRFERAVGLFEETVRVQAGTRMAFDSIVAGMAPADGREQIDLVERRTSYRTNSHIWGSQVDTYIYSVVCKLEPAIDRMLCCKLGTRLGFKRLRAGAQAVAHGFRPSQCAVTDDDQLVPLDPEAHREFGASLLLPFCSQPLPEFKRRVVRDGWVYSELADDALGQANAVDLAVGNIERRPIAAVTDGAALHLLEGLQFRTPAERLIFDMIVHRPSIGRVQPKLIMAAGLAAENSLASLLDGERFPLRTDVRLVPGGLRAAATPHMPRYVDMVQYACDRLGWNPDEFDVYRGVVQYPILHSTAVMQLITPMPAPMPAAAPTP